jgi:hypothetical protein
VALQVDVGSPDGVGAFADTYIIKECAILSPPADGRRQQSQQHISEHRRLVLSRTSHQWILGPNGFERSYTQDWRSGRAPAS